MRVLQTIVFILLLQSALSAKELWFEVNTANFRVAGESERVREVAAKLERFHESFHNTFTKLRFETPVPTKVIVFQNNPRYKSTFITAEDTNYISATPDDDLADVLHSYARFQIDNNFGRSKIPAWLSRGLGEYFAKRKGNEGLLISQQVNLSGLQNLLETDEFTLQSQTKERKDLFNAQSLAFISFLLQIRTFSSIENLIELLQRGKTVREALILNYDFDFKEAENQFLQFQKQPKLLTNGYLPVSNQAYQSSPVSEAGRLAIIGEFLYYSNRYREAAEFLESSLTIEPNLPLALTTLALIRAKEFYYSEAEDLAERAVRIEPQNFLNYYRYAVVLSRQGMTELGFVSGYRPALADQMRHLLKKSIELNPAFAESYALLAFVNYVRNEQLDEALELLKNSFRLAPQNQRYLLRRAELNLRKEKFIEARRDALEVLHFAPDESIKLYAQNTLQRIDSTEVQLSRIRDEKRKYVNDDIVTERPLSDEAIRQLREKAVADQIRLSLRRPKVGEKRLIASLTRIECGKDTIYFFFNTSSGLLRLRTKSLEDVSLISYIEGLIGFQLNCGNVVRENYASIIYGGEMRPDNLISIEFVPKGFGFPEDLN